MLTLYRSYFISSPVLLSTHTFKSLLSEKCWGRCFHLYLLTFFFLHKQGGLCHLIGETGGASRALSTDPLNYGLQVLFSLCFGSAGQMSPPGRHRPQSHLGQPVMYLCLRSAPFHREVLWDRLQGENAKMQMNPILQSSFTSNNSIYSYPSLTRTSISQLIQNLEGKGMRSIGIFQIPTRIDLCLKQMVFSASMYVKFLPYFSWIILKKVTGTTWEQCRNCGRVVISQCFNFSFRVLKMENFFH